MGFFENIFGDNFEIAYKEGVEQTSSVINTYVDPDMFADALADAGIDYDSLSQNNSFIDNYTNLLLSSPDKASKLRSDMGEILKESLEKQQPGLTQALLDKAKSLDSETDIESLAVAIMSKGPMAIDNIPLNGKTYGIAVLPSEALDSKDEAIDFLINDGITYDKNTLDAIKDNMPGTDADWAKIIGMHEGQHLDAKDSGKGSVNELQSEAEADQRIISEIRSSISETSNLYIDDFEEEQDRIDPEMLLAMKDLRALGASNQDPEHATTPLLDSGDQASSLHIEVAKIYKEQMFKEVNESFDFDAYEGTAKNAKELLKENPEAFFEVVNNGLDELRTDAIKAYNQAPSSFDNRATVVGAQILTDYINDFEDAYNRRVLDKDIPEKIHSAQFIPQEVENEFYADLKHENALNAIEKEDVEATTYNRDDAFKDFDWENYKGKAENPSDLFWQDQGTYFTVIKDHIENLKNTSIKRYANDPSRENLEKMIQAEHIIDKFAGNINYNLEQEFGDDAPQISTEHFVPEDKKREYYESRLADKNATKETLGIDTPDQLQPNSLKDNETNKNYQQGVDGTAYTAQVSITKSGEPNVDFEKGVTVAGIPVSDFFAKNAAPATEDIELVNAISPETADISTISQPQESNLTTQNLG